MRLNKRFSVWITMQTIILVVCIALSPVVYATETIPTETTASEVTTAPPTEPPTVVTTTVTTASPVTTAVTTTVQTKPSGTTATTTTTQVQLPDTMSDEEREHVNNLHEQRVELQEQVNALEESRSYYADTLEGLLLQQDSIRKEITLKQQEIDLNAQIKDAIQQQISLNDEEIMQQEQAYLVRRQSILKRYDHLRQKLRAVSKVGDMSVYLKLLDAKTYTEFLLTHKAVNLLSTADNVIFLKLQEEIKNIQKEKSTLETRRRLLDEQIAPYVSAEYTLENSRRELLSLLDESNRIADELSTYIDYYRGEYAKLIVEQGELRAQITDIVKNYHTTDMYIAAQMEWPAPTCNVITSSFKSRWGRWHYGLDIAGWGDSTGEPIVAAADGTVIFAAGNDNSGYGKYVMIDHGYDFEGNRIITLYGHCSELLVSEGDIVLGGSSQIARVGNTGNSTGPHLHFEVRVNGRAVDPVGQGYILTGGINVIG